jgi:hypothetical protein
MMLTLIWTTASFGQFTSGSSGTDGALNVTSDVVINMADHPDGIYHYTSVDVAAGAMVSFVPNADNTPVVWLVQGDVRIAGIVDVSGQDGAPSTDPPSFAPGGPGGFTGGWRSALGTSGFGPGGGTNAYGGFNYGNELLQPLVGGSGGSGFSGGGGSGGGGAIMIAADGTIELIDSSDMGFEAGGIYSEGGMSIGYFGSPGAIRLVASEISGNGVLSGASNRVRMESFVNSYVGSSNAIMTSPRTLFFPNELVPTLTVTSLAGQTVPGSASGLITSPDLSIASGDPVTVNISATRVPPGTTVRVRLIPESGNHIDTDSEPLIGTFTSSTTTASVTFPAGVSRVELYSTFSPQE